MNVCPPHATLMLLVPITMDPIPAAVSRVLQGMEYQTVQVFNLHNILELSVEIKRVKK